MSAAAFVASPISDWMGDIANDGARSLAAGVVEAANWAMFTALGQMQSGLRVNLGADYVQSVYNMVRYLVFPVIAVLFVFQVIKAIVSGQARSLWAAIGGAALGIVGGAAGAALVAGLLAIVDEFTAFVLGDAQKTAEHAMVQVFSMDNLSGLGWLIVVIVGLLAVLAFLMIMGVMIVRKAMIIATVVFGPLAFAGAATERTQKWVWRWVEVVIGLALAKLVIAVILTLGFAALDSWQTNTTFDVIVGVFWVMLAAAAPLGVMKFVSFAGTEIANSRPSGIREAAGNIAAPARSIGPKLAAAGAAGWAAARGISATSAGSGSAGSKPSSPAEAAGGPARSTPSGDAAGGVGAGGSAPNGGGASSAGLGAPSGGSATTATTGRQSAGASPVESKRAPVSAGTGESSSGESGQSVESPGDLNRIGAAASASPTSAASSRRGGGERRTDAQAQPDMNALLARTFEAGGRKRMVQPGPMARAMGVPESQAERMFMKAEAAGVLGPRDMQGRRQVLKPPPPAARPVGAAATHTSSKH